MTQKLSEHETAELRLLVSNPVFVKAVELILGELWAEKRGATTTEQSALNYQFHDGACACINKLMCFSEKKDKAVIAPSRLRHAPLSY